MRFGATGLADESLAQYWNEQKALNATAGPCRSFQWRGGDDFEDDTTAQTQPDPHRVSEVVVISNASDDQ